MLTLLINESNPLDGLFANATTGGIGSVPDISVADEGQAVSVQSFTRAAGVITDSFVAGDVLHIGIGDGVNAPVCYVALSSASPATGTMPINTAGMVALFAATVANQLSLTLAVVRTRGAYTNTIFSAPIVIRRSAINISTAVPTPSILGTGVAAALQVAINTALGFVRLDASARLPAVDGSQLTNVPNELPSQTGNSGKYLTTNGTATSWGAVSTGLTVGTTAIAAGTTTRVLYDNAGILGEYTISGTGSVAMTNSPTFTTPNLDTPSALVGTNITGTASGLTAGNATLAATVTVANEAADTTCFPLFATAATGSLAAKSNAGITFNSATGLLSATGMAGAFNGTVGATTPSTIAGTTGTFSGAVTGATFNAVSLNRGLNDAGRNVALGSNSLGSATTGDTNTAIGHSVLTNLTTGDFNVGVGRSALALNLAGIQNTAIGWQSLFSATGSGNVGIGASAGLYETGSNSLYIDNQDRTNTAGDKAKALLYGTFAATAAAQQLTINAGTITMAGSAVTATSYAGAGTGLTGTASGLTAGNATLAATVTVASETADTTCFPLFVTAATGSLEAKSHFALAFNSVTGRLDSSGLSTSNAGGTIFTVGAVAEIFTQGDTAHIYTSGANAYIESRSTFKLNGGTFKTTLSHAATANRAIAFPDATGTLLLSDGSGANLTTLNASNISSGTLAAARMANAGVHTGDATGTFPAITLNAAQTGITSVGTLTGGATGAGFTVALSTSTITGSLADARLSANVPLLNASNTYTGTTNSFTLPTTTGTTTAAGVAFNANSLTTGTGIYAASSTLTSGKLVDIQVSGTAAAAGQVGLNIATAGANGTSGITTTGATITNTHTGTTSTNIALTLQATGGTANTALQINHSDATPRLRFGVLSTSTGYGGIWGGNTTLSTTNHALYSDGTTTYINGSGGNLYLSASGVDKAIITSASLRTLVTTDASNSTTAALLCDGGLGISKGAYIGTFLNVGTTLAVTGATTLSAALITTPQALSGAGAINLTTAATDFTSTGAANALTLANGTVGQFKFISHAVKGTLGTGVLTPTTCIGFTTITFNNAGDSVTLRYTSAGWAVHGSFGAVIA